MLDDFFSTETDGLEPVERPRTLRLHDGDEIDLRIRPVRKRSAATSLRMLAYNGSIPGSDLARRSGFASSRSKCRTTATWKRPCTGTACASRTDTTACRSRPKRRSRSAATTPSSSSSPTRACYWYHPHIREDYGLELGLYGTVVVEPSDPSYWAPADRLLDLDARRPPGRGPQDRTLPALRADLHGHGPLRQRHADERRDRSSSAKRAVGEVVRLYLVNTANTRIFRFGIAGARMKLVGGDSGRHEHESFVDDVLLAPSERAVVDVLFDTAGDARLEHRTPEHIYDLGTISVTGKVDGRCRGVVRHPAHRSRAHGARERDRATSSSVHPTRPWRSGPRCRCCTARRSEDTAETTYHACPMHADDRGLVRGDLPQVRHEARPRRSGTADADAVRVPDARRDHRLVVGDSAHCAG